MNNFFSIHTKMKYTIVFKKKELTFGYVIMKLIVYL